MQQDAVSKRPNMKFSYYKAPIYNTIPLGDVSLEYVANKIKGLDFATITREYRAMPEITKEEADRKGEAKLQLFDYATFSGTFPPGEREAEKKKTESGLTCIDIDHLDNTCYSVEEMKQAICEDPHLAVCLAFVSPSGDGLKVVLKRPEGFLNKQYYLAVAAYIHVAYATDIKVDMRCTDISRPCFLCHDPEAYYNPSPREMTPEELSSWRNDYDIEDTPERDRMEGATDPRDKPGLVGAFNRQYSIAEAIAKYLPKIYTRTAPRRYKYAQSKHPAGLVIYSDGYTAFSNHDTDPAGGRALNAFDLVRIHLFGNDEGGPDSESFRKMCALVQKDSAVQESINEQAFRDVVLTRQKALDNYKGVGAECLQTIDPIDIRKESEKLGQKPGKKDLSQRAVEVVIMDSLISYFNLRGWGLAYHNDKPYIFNGQYWRFLDKTQIKLFLRSAALALGCPPIIIRQWKNLKSLLEQFCEDCLIEAPERDLNTVRINFQNGTLEISRESAELKEFDKNDFLTYQLPYEYNPTAEAPLFKKYFDRVLPDLEAQRLIAEYIGNALVPSLHLQKALFLIGGGNNGKSVFCDIIKAALGKDNVSAFSLSSLTKEDSHSRAQLEDKLLNYCSDISTSLNVENFKLLVRGEEIEARYLFKESFIMRHYARQMFNCNTFPTTVENTEGFWRSSLTIPFEQTISPQERDPDLASKIIAAELPGIMNWILEGTKRIIRNRKFSPCALADQTLEKYRIASNSTLSFLQDIGYKPGNDESIQITELYSQYKVFCNDATRQPVNRTHFKENLAKAGYFINRVGTGTRVYYSRQAKATIQDTDNDNCIDDIF